MTASNTSNSDLFFASRGGRGNAYGVVTKYTVQSSDTLLGNSSRAISSTPFLRRIPSL
ncbi:unnamed protein product [Penicillium nalgiovense]|nr:unnamed protein product [Penicillium nalgiovense]